MSRKCCTVQLEDNMEHMCDICDEIPAMTYHDILGAICRDCRRAYADKVDNQSQNVWDATITGDVESD